MQKIIEAIDKAKHEYKSADHYADLALQYKETDKALADVYAAIGAEEIAHGDKIHAQLVRIIQEHRAKHGAPDPVMQKQYDIEHQKLMQKAAKSKAKLEMYKKPT